MVADSCSKRVESDHGDTVSDFEAGLKAGSDSNAQRPLREASIIKSRCCHMRSCRRCRTGVLHLKGDGDGGIFVKGRLFSFVPITPANVTAR